MPQPLLRRLLAAVSPVEYQRQLTEAAANLTLGIPSQMSGFYSDPSFGIGIVESEPSKRKEVQQQAYTLWQTDPLGGAIVNWTSMFVMGEGIAVSHPDAKVNEFIQEWWNWNAMDDLQDKWCEELAVFGELFLELIPNEGGRLGVVSIDPRTIIAIDTDQNDVRRVRSYYQRFTSTVYKTGDSSTSVNDERTIPAETVIHSKINSVSFAKFGSSDLLRVLAPIPMYKRWLADRARVNWMKNNYYIDVTVKGGGKVTDAVAGRIKKLGKQLAPGSIIVHGDDEQWEIKQPSIAAGDASEDGRAIKLYVAAGANIPEYLLGDASNANLASSQSQQMPLVKRFRKRQKHMARLFQTVLSAVVRQGIAAKSVPATFDDEQTDGSKITRPSDAADQFVLTFPQIVDTDVKAAVEALMPMFTSKLISGRSLVTRVGFDYDEEQSLRRQEEEADDRLEQMPDDGDGMDDEGEPPPGDDAPDAQDGTDAPTPPAN